MKTTLNLAAVAQVFFFYGYVIYVWRTIGVQKSISDSWYQLPKGKNHRFVMFAAGTGIPFWIYGMLGIPLYAEMMFVLSGFFMFCISIASTFKSSSMVANIHNTCTGLAITLALGGIYVIEQNFFFPVCLAISVVSLIFLIEKNRIWWIEIWIFTWIIAKLLSIPWQH